MSLIACEYFPLNLIVDEINRLPSIWRRRWDLLEMLDPKSISTTHVHLKAIAFLSSTWRNRLTIFHSVWFEKYSTQFEPKRKQSVRKRLFTTNTGTSDRYSHTYTASRCCVANKPNKQNTLQLNVELTANRRIAWISIEQRSLCCVACCVVTIVFEWLRNVNTATWVYHHRWVCWIFCSSHTNRQYAIENRTEFHWKSHVIHVIVHIPISLDLVFVRFKVTSQSDGSEFEKAVFDYSPLILHFSINSVYFVENVNCFDVLRSPKKKKKINKISENFAWTKEKRGKKEKLNCGIHYRHRIEQRNCLGVIYASFFVLSPFDINRKPTTTLNKHNCQWVVNLQIEYFRCCSFLFEFFLFFFLFWFLLKSLIWWKVNRRTTFTQNGWGRLC